MTATDAASLMDGRIRPSRFPQDVTGILRLMEVCFADKLDPDSRAAFREYREIAAWGQPVWGLARLLGMVHAEEWFGGVVWDRDGMLAGNASITPGAFHRDAWLIGNVAVLPENRRHGIGRDLVRAALADIAARGGRQVYLQVDRENETAVRIYREFGFEAVSLRTIWFRPKDAPGCAQPVGGEPRVASRKPEEWEAAYRILRETLPEGLLWNVPLGAEMLRPSLLRGLGLWLAGEAEADWLAAANGCVVGCCRSRIRAFDQEAWAFAREEHAAWAVPALAQAAIDRDGGRTAMTLETKGESAAPALERMGFQRKRTSVWMKRPVSV